MRGFRVIALLGLIGLFVGITGLDEALAGEKMKGRCNWYTVKYD